MGPTAPHLVLLGDSIFDNRWYTGGEPDVASHLRGVLPDGWRVTLCAVDGAVTEDLKRQTTCIPEDASHLIVAVGGNDALRNSDLLSLAASSSTDVLHTFADRIARFEASYAAALRSVLDVNLETVVCTIYNGALDAELVRIAKVALTPFNDVIIRTAAMLDIDVVELRHVCTDAADYVNRIEPSGRGGRKIAIAVAAAVGAVDTKIPPIRLWRNTE